MPDAISKPGDLTHQSYWQPERHSVARGLISLTARDMNVSQSLFRAAKHFESGRIDAPDDMQRCDGTFIGAKSSRPRPFGAD